MFGKVLVGVDGRQGGRDAIALAKQLAHPGGQMTLVHLYGNMMLGRGGALMLPTEPEESLQLLALERADAAVDAELLAFAAPSVGRGLHQLAEQHQADLLVVGSCNRGVLGRTFLGDDTRASLNGSPCAIAIAPSGYAETPHRLGNVGIGYDSSPESHRALGVARALAERHGSAIRALSVVSLQSIPYGEPIPVGWPEIAMGLVDDELKRFHGVEDVEGDATYGEPSEELAEFAAEVDLLIVGSRGYGRVGRLFNGSTSNYLARHTSCPLVVLPRLSALNEEHDEVAGRETQMPVEADSGAEALR